MRALAICLIFSASFLGCGRSSRDDLKRNDLKNIFGSDNRVDLAVDSFPGRAVGRLEVGCSGAMVGRKLALTAAHCVIDTATGGIKSGLTYFQAGYKNGTSLKKSFIVGAWFGSKTPEAERRSDWAVLLLSDDIGSETGYFGVKSVTVADQLPLTVSLAGYATDRSRAEVPFKVDSCYIHKVDENGRLLHDCDAATGTSGGPIFRGTGTALEIVALTAAEFRTGNSSMNRDTYDNTYANIAVSGERFGNVVLSLRNSVDAGLSAPAFAESEAFYVANGNANPGPGGDEDGNGNGGNGGNGNNVNQIDSALVQQITNQSYAINHLALRGLTNVSSLLDLSNSMSWPAVFGAAAAVERNLDLIQAYSRDINLLQCDRTEGSKLLLAERAEMTVNLADLERLIGRLVGPSAQQAQFLLGELRNVQTQIQQLTTL